MRERYLGEQVVAREHGGKSSDAASVT